MGAELIEGAAVSEVKLDDGSWSVRCKDGRQFSARCLIAADGAKKGMVFYDPKFVLAN